MVFVLALYPEEVIRAVVGAAVLTVMVRAIGPPPSG
jgi:hypothetical protein